MALTPEAAHLEKVRDARVAQVQETLCDVFGQVSIDVMFRAVGRWFGIVIFNSCQTPTDRRDVLQHFVDQIEGQIAGYEKGQGQ